MSDRRHEMAQIMRHFAVLTDFVPLKWHDLARQIAGYCENKIRAIVRLAFSRNSSVWRENTAIGAWAMRAGPARWWIVDFSSDADERAARQPVTARRCAAPLEWRRGGNDGQLGLE